MTWKSVGGLELLILLSHDFLAPLARAIKECVCISVDTFKRLWMLMTPLSDKKSWESLI